MDAKGYPVKNIALIRRIADLINAREHRTVLKNMKFEQLRGMIGTQKVCLKTESYGILRGKLKAHSVN